MVWIHDDGDDGDDGDDDFVVFIFVGTTRNPSAKAKKRRGGNK